VSTRWDGALPVLVVGGGMITEEVILTTVFQEQRAGRVGPVSVASRRAGTIAHLLEQRRRQRRQPPPIRLVLPDHPGVRTLDVTPHRLESYDALTRPDPNDTQ
jgi:hypothetical protein